jgi:hypothetical protein
MNPDIFFSESDPIAAIVERDDLDELVEEWLAAINGPKAEVARDERRTVSRLKRLTR